MQRGVQVMALQKTLELEQRKRQADASERHLQIQAGPSPCSFQTLTCSCPKCEPRCSRTEVVRASVTQQCRQKSAACLQLRLGT